MVESVEVKYFCEIYSVVSRSVATGFGLVLQRGCTSTRFIPNGEDFCFVFLCYLILVLLARGCDDFPCCNGISLYVTVSSY